MQIDRIASGTFAFSMYETGLGLVIKGRWESKQNQEEFKKK